MAITRIQTAKNSATSANQVVVTLGSAPTDGNSLILCYTGVLSGGTPSISSIIQSGVTWTFAIGVTNAGNPRIRSDIWYAQNVSSAGSTITINTALSADLTAIVSEYSGLLTSSMLEDQSAASVGSSSTSDTGTTGTTTSADQLWVGGIGNNSETQSSPTNGFTIVDQIEDGNANGAFLEKIVSAEGTANTGTTLASSVGWAGVIATFHAELEGLSEATSTAALETDTEGLSEASSTATANPIQGLSEASSAATANPIQGLSEASSAASLETDVEGLSEAASTASLETNNEGLSEATSIATVEAFIPRVIYPAIPCAGFERIGELAPLELVAYGLKGDSVINNKLKIVNMHRLEVDPTYSGDPYVFEGPAGAGTPNKLGFKPGDKLQLFNTDKPNHERIFTFADPSDIEVYEEVTLPDTNSYEFFAFRREA